MTGVSVLVRRAASLIAMTAALVVVSAPAASAHNLHSGPQPSNYLSVLNDFRAPTPDVRMHLLDDGLHLQLVVHGRHEVVVLGYSGVPYLRVTDRGAAVNTRSPDYYLNRTTNLSTLPTNADVGNPPRWSSLGSAPTVTWHDHRTHFMGSTPPPQVQAEPGVRQVIDTWVVPVTIDGISVLARGQLLWVPGPSPRPYLLAGLGAAALLTLVCLRRRWWPHALALTATAVVAVEVVRAVSLYVGRSGSIPTRLAAVAGYGGIEVVLVAVLVVLLLAAVRRRASAAGFAVFLAALTLLTQDLPGLSVLWRSQMLTGLAPTPFRVLTVTSLVLSVALLISGAILLRRLAPLDRVAVPSTLTKEFA